MSEQETFKAGERVVRTSSGHDMGSICIIERITPSGTIIIGGEKFSPSGRRKSNEKWNFVYIHKLTPEWQAKITRARRISLVKSFTFELLPDDELARLAGVIAALNEIKAKGEK